MSLLAIQDDFNIHQRIPDLDPSYVSPDCVEGLEGQI